MQRELQVMAPVIQRTGMTVDLAWACRSDPSTDTSISARARNIGYDTRPLSRGHGRFAGNTDT